MIAEKSVQKHINTIFSKLQLSEETDAHRRVRAVRLWLADTDVLTGAHVTRRCRVPTLDRRTGRVPAAAAE